MNREELLDRATAALGAARCTIGCTVESHTREGARAVLDAVLPVVTTVDELRVLPSVAVLVSEKGATHRAMNLVTMDERGISLVGFPYTVVWQPEVTS